MGRRNKYDEREKEYRKLKRIWNKLWEIKCANMWEDLPKPQKYGWIKELTLTKEVLRRKDWEVFQQVLDACKVYSWASSKAQLEKQWQVTYKNKKPQKSGMKVICPANFKRLSSSAQKYFMKRESKAIYSNPQTRYVYECTLPRIFFDEKYSRAYVYRKRKINREVESEIAEIAGRLKSEYYDIQLRYGWKERDEWGDHSKIECKTALKKGIFHFLKTGEENEFIYQDYKIGW